jgi:hypothetical protein
MSVTMTVLLAAVGAGFIAVGVAMINPAAGLITAGVLAVAGALVTPNR